MAGAASAHQAATATHGDTSQEKAGRRRRSSANRQGSQQGATATAATAPAALDSLSRLQQLADASPRVAQLRRLQALADGHYTPVAQLAGAPEEEELIQGKFATAELPPQLQQPPRANNTGLPDQLKSGLESLSGLSMDHVRVHYNSAQPAQLNALAYAQGSDIHLAPGQEQHLPHEAWHVVQQAQRRVRPTMQMKSGVPVNGDAGLEREADVMGARAAAGVQKVACDEVKAGRDLPYPIIQRRAGIEYETGIEAREPDHPLDADNFIGRVAQDEEMLVSGHGWKVVSDNSKLEFVTDPPVDTQELAKVFEHMMSAVKTLRTHLGNARSNFHSGFNGLPVTTNYTLLPYRAGPASGSMQGTIGVPLNRLFAFFQLLTTYELKANDRLFEAHKTKLAKIARTNKTNKDANAGGVSDDLLKLAREAIKGESAAGTKALNPEDIKIYERISAATNEAIKVHKKRLSMQRTDEIDALKGVLHFVAQYGVFAANSKDGYKKKAFPVLARSSFSSMYDALPKECKDCFGELAAYVLQQIELDLNQKAFSMRNEKDLGRTATFTLKEWLNSIIKPKERYLIDSPGEYIKYVDTEDVYNYKYVTADLMTAPGVDVYATDNSMGTMSLDNGLVVVELRTIKHLVRDPFWTHDPDTALKFVTDLANLEKP